MGNRDRGNPHPFTHDDGAGFFVDHDPGHGIRIDLQPFQDGDELDAFFLISRRDPDPEAPAVDRAGQFAVEEFVDHRRHARNGREVGLHQTVGQRLGRVQGKGHLPLHKGPVGNAAGRRMILLHLGRLAAKGQRSHDQRPLGDGVDIAVGSLERGHEQAAADQAVGIADGRHLDVDGGAGLGESGQLGGDHDRGDIVHLDQVAVDGYPQALHHADQRLHGELGAVTVARAIQADHQAVPDQLVAAHAFKAGDILDPRGQGGSGQQKQRPQQGGHPYSYR